MRRRGHSVLATFPLVIPTSGQVSHVLLTRSPLTHIRRSPWTSFDLHVLSTPPAFVLSQDQTLQQKRGREQRQRKSDEHPTQQTVQLKHPAVCGHPQSRPSKLDPPRTTDIHVAAGLKPTAKLTDSLSQHPKRDADRTARTGVLSSLPFSRSRSPEQRPPPGTKPRQSVDSNTHPRRPTASEKRRATLTPPKQRSEFVARQGWAWRRRRGRRPGLTERRRSPSGFGAAIRVTEPNVIGGRRAASGHATRSGARRLLIANTARRDADRECRPSRSHSARPPR